MRVEARLGRIVRDHPGWVDAAVVVLAFGASLGSLWYVRTLVALPVALLLNLVSPIALVWRRQAPGRVLGIVLGLALLQWALAVTINLVQVSALFAVYSVARYGSRRQARIGLGAALLLVTIAPLRQPYSGPGTVLWLAVLVTVVHLLGTNMGLRQSYLRALEERAERLERERDGAAEVAAARERTRIARELHDVVAHHVSVMVVQAEGAGWAIDDRPEQARQAVATIASTGRSTLVELRRLLGVLRSDERDGMSPQPGLTDLPALVEGFRAGGLAVVLVAEPASSWSDVPESLQLAAFRIVQEGLTNVLKHAGPTARAEVTVRIEGRDGGNRLVVVVQDDGQGLSVDNGSVVSGSVVNRSAVGESVLGGSVAGESVGGESAAGGTAVDGPGVGHGLIGIRERTALFGGEVVIGPRVAASASSLSSSSGSVRGFEVRAVLPFDAVRSSPAGRPVRTDARGGGSR